MGDFTSFGGSDEENAEIRKLNAEVEADPDSFEAWEKLVRACESLEGGLNRNSSPQALATLRDAYDRFLIKFPLLFGYWKKYADLEFNISGPESAEMVYERGCASITNSVDLWTDYCSFKMETTHVAHLVRELFERAATYVGLDFLAHPFWDKYIEYEERQEAHDKIYAILKRVIHVPMHQYARYYERFRTLSHSRPLEEVVETEVLTRFRAEVDAEAAPFGVVKSELEIERDIRAKIDAMFYDVFQTTQSETTKRWTYESEIKRPYFHVTELDHSQLANWRKYLDFEEAEGDFTRVTALYERCLVTCAFYEEFWLRYTRWMQAQPNKDEEVRNIFLRAVTLYVPISRPGIRLQFAYFEETCGRVDVARAVHEAVLMKIPNCVEAIISWANLQRRQSGLDAAIDVYKAQIDSPGVDLYTKAALVTEWALLLWKVKGSIEEARTVFRSNVQWYSDSREFWGKWLDFELEQPTNTELEVEHGKRIEHVIDEMRARSRMSAATKKQLCGKYLNYLQQRGGKDSMKKFLLVDREMFGPLSISKDKFAAKDNGVPLGELDEATQQKAEARYFSFYELYVEPDPKAQGTATFH
ncbi:pre-mrna-processing factor 39 [Diaporthe amygdali]|uniref:pre-mrna-processing factor 39 n=1 Tax=Phomopsis amygdali TaxID=1214568 RepID=UPI0022FE657D|nr:pre-mrna-processing factor 39 [Diaporthe amygdali]KAJ0121442.1 pre-mrna-processing factor 39 [Diaporthe amygdali]